jgi:hypothetical protein
MQQLTPRQLGKSLQYETDAITINLPLPKEQSEGKDFCLMLIDGLQARCQSLDIGADRVQGVLYLGDESALLHIDWLCEAIWLTPVGEQGHNYTVKLSQLWKTLERQLSISS